MEQRKREKKEENREKVRDEKKVSVFGGLIGLGILLFKKTRFSWAMERVGQELNNFSLIFKKMYILTQYVCFRSDRLILRYKLKPKLVFKPMLTFLVTRFFFGLVRFGSPVLWFQCPPYIDY